MFLNLCVYFIIVCFFGFLAYALSGRHPKARRVLGLLVRLCISPEALSGEAGTLGNDRPKRCCCRRRQRRRNNGSGPSGSGSGWIGVGVGGGGGGGGGGGEGGQDGGEEKHGIAMVDNPYPSFRSTGTDTTPSAQAPAATSTSSPTATRTSLEAAAGHTVKSMEGEGEDHHDGDLSEMSISADGSSQASWSEGDQTSDNEEKGGDVIVSHQTSRRNGSTEL